MSLYDAYSHVGVAGQVFQVPTPLRGERLLNAPDRYEAHVRARHGVTDRRGVSRIVLAAVYSSFLGSDGKVYR